VHKALEISQQEFKREVEKKLLFRERYLNPILLVRVGYGKLLE